MIVPLALIFTYTGEPMTTIIITRDGGSFIIHIIIVIGRHQEKESRRFGNAIFFSSTGRYNQGMSNGVAT